ncbi:MAG: amino acid ABC transporter substrate-binding protein [Candidatus Elarobacter sp.]
MTRRFPYRIAAVAAVAALLGSAMPATTVAADLPPIVIGATISETGSYAVDAKYALEGYQLWIKEQNAKGGLLGRKLELKTYDDASDPATAVSLYERLIDQDHVNVIVGPYSSAITAAVANVAEKHKMPMISPEVSAAAPFKRGLHYLFMGIAQSTHYVEGAIEIAKANGYKRIAVTGEDSAFPRSIAGALPDLVKVAGLEVVYSELYPHNASDYSAVAQKIKQANADAVFSISYFPDAIGMLRALKQANVTPKLLYFAVGPTEPNFGKEAGKDSDGVIATTNWSANLKTPNNAEFAKDFAATYKTAPDYHAAANYAALEVLGAAISRVKSLDQEKLRDQLANTKMRTVMGNYEVDPNTGLQLGYTSLTLQWQGGKQYIVAPAAMSERKAIVPFPAWSAH